MKHYYSKSCCFSLLVTLHYLIQPLLLIQTRCDCDWLWPTMAVITIQKWTINTMWQSTCLNVVLWHHWKTNVRSGQATQHFITNIAHSSTDAFGCLSSTTCHHDFTHSSHCHTTYKSNDGSKNPKNMIIDYWFISDLERNLDDDDDDDADDGQWKWKVVKSNSNSQRACLGVAAQWGSQAKRTDLAPRQGGGTILSPYYRSGLKILYIYHISYM